MHTVTLICFEKRKLTLYFKNNATKGVPFVPELILIELLSHSYSITFALGDNGNNL